MNQTLKRVGLQCLMQNGAGGKMSAEESFEIFYEPTFILSLVRRISDIS